MVSQDKGGLWMKMESKQETNPSESSPEIFKEKLQVETNCSPAAPVPIKRYYGVMDDEGADDVFIHSFQPPPTCSAPFLTAKGSQGATASNSGVTLSNGAADATEAKANPTGLDWHHSEKQLMAARNESEEGISSTVQTSRQSMDNGLLFNDKGSTPTAHEDQTPTDSEAFLMEACHDEAENQYQDNASGDEDSNKEPEDIIILSEGEENCGETDTEDDKYPQQTSSDVKETSENEICRDKGGDKTKHKDSCCLDERDVEMSRDHLDSESVETNATTLPGLRENDDFESSEPEEHCEYKQDTIEEATNQPQVSDFSADGANDSEGHVNSRSLDYNLMRESGTTETQTPITKCSEEMVEKVDGSRRLTIEIQQGEQLLQRLQMVQLRHEEIQSFPPEVAKGLTGGGKVAFGAEIQDGRVKGRSMTGEEEEEESRFPAEKQDEVKTNLTPNDKNESKHVEIKAGTSLSSSTPGQPEQKQITGTETSVSEDDQSNNSVPSDLTLNNCHEASCTKIPLVSTGFSAADTSVERQIHESAQGKPNLQRAGGVFNLADNPDVLEIPFKTNVTLESLLTKACISQPNHWQFSEKKMQKEISKESQRELAMVNQGKIPGGYSKGEVRQLKETKLLFEAFQQDNTESPQRLRKAPTTLMKDHVYPSVLERTHSLEMVSLKSCPVTRAHSLRPFDSGISDSDKSPGNLRSRSPTGCSRDKTRLSPYPKQDKHQRLHRSMESISSEVTTSAKEMRGKTGEANDSQESPILKHNPFFKLRPALALQPEVAKDIQEAKDREEELRRQRSTLYGELKQESQDEEMSRCTKALKSDSRQQSRGKLERVWPPPSKKDQKKSEQPQEPKVHRAGGPKAPLWQRWESGLINGQAPNEKK
ncbi:uncharacterized protein PAE49_023006 isoform 2-T2 [Odontesthes bonariensis]|uniref:uncharacterized protein LOC142371456 isoform X2 n=1 Tax=Odontesthes bonariensis TaxID=219752 RepID=UPI003F586EC4